MLSNTTTTTTTTTDVDDKNNHDGDVDGAIKIETEWTGDPMSKTLTPTMKFH